MIYTTSNSKDYEWTIKYQKGKYIWIKIRKTGQLELFTKEDLCHQKK